MGVLIALPIVSAARERSQMRSQMRSQLADAARAYAEAANAFEARTGHSPVMGTADWPDPAAGPVDEHGAPYLDEVPVLVRYHGYEVVQSDSGTSFVSGLASIEPRGRETIVWVPEASKLPDGTTVGPRVIARWRHLIGCLATGNPIRVECDER